MDHHSHEKAPEWADEQLESYSFRHPHDAPFGPQAPEAFMDSARVPSDPPFYPLPEWPKTTPTQTRTFSTGATRNSDEGKYDFEGFLSPLVIKRFGEYMHKHRHLADGSLRDSDNWQRGIPRPQLIKSGWRHMFDWWAHHRGVKPLDPTSVEDALCGLIFNAMGYLHETLVENEGKAGPSGALA